MKKTALVFPGQGSQTMGMCKQEYDTYDTIKTLFKKASDVFDIDMAKLCFETENEILSQTINSQPAIFLSSISMLEALKEKGVTFDGVCGFSLGEISALVASNIYSFEDGCTVISKRAKTMHESGNSVKGGMAAIIGLESEVVENVCNDVEGYVECVNYNCPKQVVIAGTEDALDKAMAKCKELKAMKVVKLAVSGAFHSKLMDNASKDFFNLINKVKTAPPTCEVYTNVTADILSDSDIASYLKTQMVSPVKFTSSIEKMIENGFTTFIEVGSGRVLSGLIKRICRNVEILSASDLILK